MLAKSSAEAEYRGMNIVTCEFCYSNSSKSCFYEKTKHFEIELFFLREKVSAGVVKTVKVKSVDNVADRFTKDVYSPPLQYHQSLWALRELAVAKRKLKELRARQIRCVKPFVKPFYEKTKHFEIELFFLREKVSAGVVKTVKVKSVDNVADRFTKGLSVQDHNKFCDLLGLFDMYKS
ncbi:hypothetical protein Tco_1423464 [Tanacetum coccineum]